MSVSKTAVEGGTSPRVWGKPYDDLRHDARQRNIPTRVGKTPDVVRFPDRAAEHPHACGEYITLGSSHAPRCGTSPRVWGKLADQSPGTFMTRNIPTRVGKTLFRQAASVNRPEHPHACGENVTGLAFAGIALGTSPRVWGKLTLAHFAPRRFRNIPTRVGKTPCTRIGRLKWPEHPHACGENFTYSPEAAAEYGTSPRVWGKPWRVEVQRATRRNIPTRVGKTLSRLRAKSDCAEHPHACGENYTVPCVLHDCRGTSPRVWGKQSRAGARNAGGRNIPTRVGKTTRLRRNSPLYEEHPHACGENQPSMVKVNRIDGTSPRVWGKLVKCCKSHFSTRNIPTRVGKTKCGVPSAWCKTEHPHACGENSRGVHSLHL